MIRIGIIAGGGELPLLVGKNLIKKNFSVTFFVIKEFFNENFYSNYQTDNYNVYSTYSVNNRKRTQEGFRRVYSIYSADNSIVYAYDYNFLGASDAFGQSFKIGTDFSLTETLKLNAEAIYKNHYKTKFFQL